MKLPLFNGYGGEPYKGLPEDRFKFLKHELVEGVGLYDLEARLYDPTLGRFAQVDPMSDDGGQESLTPYQYAWNNPILNSDPDGRCPGCLEMIKKWWNTPLKTGGFLQNVGRASNLHALGMDIAPETRGQLVVAYATSVMTDYAYTVPIATRNPVRVPNNSPKPQLALPAAKPQKLLIASSVAEAKRQATMNVENGTEQTMTSVAVSRVSGKTATNQSGEPRPPLNQEIENQLPTTSLEKWPCRNCAEQKAASTLLNQGERLIDLNITTIRNRTVKQDNLKIEKPCRNCQQGLDGATFINN